MADWLDFLFGRKALKDAEGKPLPAPQPEQPAGIDMGKLAQDQASRTLRPAPPAPPVPGSLKKQAEKKRQP